MYAVKLPSPRNETFKLHSQPNVYIPPEWIEKIFNRFPEGTTAHLPLMLGYKCGLRLGEAFAITWEDINFENKTLQINRQVQWDQDCGQWYFSNPKYNSYRTIDLDDQFVGLLRRAKGKQLQMQNYYADYYTYYYQDADRRISTAGTNKINFVLVRENGTYTQPRIMQHASSIIHYEIGLKDFTYHSLRHTHATMLAENDAPPKYVKERLGHKNIQVTLQYYQHLTERITQKGNVSLELLSKDLLPSPNKWQQNGNKP